MRSRLSSVLVITACVVQTSGWSAAKKPKLEVKPSWERPVVPTRDISIRGGSDRGVTITLFDNDREVASKGLNRNCKFQFDLNNLAYGEHRFRIQAERDGQTNSCQVTVRIKGPPVLVIDRTHHNRTIRARSIEARGDSEPGATVTLDVDGRRHGSRRLANSAHFVFPLEDLKPGWHHLTFVARDEFNQATQRTLDFKVKEPPPLRLDGVWTPRVTTDHTTVLSGVTEPQARVTLRMAGREFAPVVAGPSGKFAFNIADTPTGVYDITVEATDDLGQSTRRLATLRVVAPLSIVSPGNGERLGACTVDVVGVAEPRAPLELTCGQGPGLSGRAGDDGKYAFAAVELQPGPNLITVRAAPGGDLVQTATVGVIVDQSAPQIVILSPTPGQHIPLTTESVDVIVRTEPGARVSIWVYSQRRGSGVAPENGILTFRDVPFPRHVDMLRAVAVDATGNESALNRWVWRQSFPYGVP